MVKNLPAKAGDTNPSPDPGRSCMQLSPCTTTTEPVLQSPGTAATESTCHSYGACVPQSPCSTTREATTMRSSCTEPASSPRSPQLEKSPHSNKDTAQWKINKCLKKKKNKISKVSKLISILSFYRNTIQDWKTELESHTTIKNEHHKCVEQNRKTLRHTHKWQHSCEILKW